MKTLRAIAIPTLIFGLIGPAIGGVVAFAAGDPPGFVLFSLSYAFGIVPALLAGATYGAVRTRAKGDRFRWYRRALVGAGAGLAGCIGFVVMAVILFPLLGRGPAFSRHDVNFLGIMGVAGVTAGAFCGLLMLQRPPRQDS